ncbi:hypothetical protein K438DRAFT_1032377 [Mycena galopus ATCC 62051]|nr:hypothetical protein K438DRAFT_1032377 [Mycena galopus ATCC 62051]
MLSESRSTSKNEARSLPSTLDCSSEPPQTGSKSPASSLTSENLSESSEFSSSLLLSVSVTELVTARTAGMLPSLDRLSARMQGDFEPVCSGSEELSGIDGSTHGSFVDVDLDSSSVESWDYVRDALDTAMHEQAAAVIMDEVKKDSQCLELYDSGTTCHITPFRVPLALQKNPVLVRLGDLVVGVPGGVGVSKLHLTEVLYSTEVGYTLVFARNSDAETTRVGNYLS